MIAIVLAAASAFSFLEAGPTDKVALQPAADIAIGGASFVAFVVPELLKNSLTPAHCRICDGPDNSGLGPPGSHGTLNGVDAAFHDALTGFLVSRNTADTISSVWSFALVPLGSIAAAMTATGPHASDGAGLRATVIVLESAAVSAALTQGLKFVAARKRPYIRYDHADVSGTYSASDPDSRLGFPSGHTALAAALSVSVAMTATLEESEAAPWLWGGAAVATIGAASLRMMAEKHYFTDTLMSAAIGTACGVGFPLLHRRGGLLSGGSLSVGAQGPALSLSGTF